LYVDGAGSSKRLHKNLTFGDVQRSKVKSYITSREISNFQTWQVGYSRKPEF
jgi:hypothetical protein